MSECQQQQMYVIIQMRRRVPPCQRVGLQGQVQKENTRGKAFRSKIEKMWACIEHYRADHLALTTLLEKRARPFEVWRAVEKHFLLQWTLAAVCC